MGRRKRNILNDLVVMPWWCSPLAAIIAYVVDLQLILSHSPAHPGGSRDTPWLPPCPTRDLPRVDHSAAQVTASDANREPLQAVKQGRGIQGFLESWISGFLGREGSVWTVGSEVQGQLFSMAGLQAFTRRGAAVTTFRT
jgi:hypothetical protein